VKIDDKKTAGLGLTATPARTGKSAEKTGVDKAASDSVKLSPQAQALAGPDGGSGVFDSAKVNEIKAAIASGRFQVNAERVAEGLIDTVKNLIKDKR
jgi:negative regulator of flagellin synthesis FlgM